MYLVKFLVTAMVLIFLSACDAHSQPLAVCVAAAKDHLRLFSLSEKTLENRCKCVQSRRGGQLPDSLTEWGVTGGASPVLALIECSEADIYGFYQRTVFTSAKSRLEKLGERTGSIEAFSACVASGAFQEIRRDIGSENGKAGQLDKVAFRRMYDQCEAATK